MTEDESDSHTRAWDQGKKQLHCYVCASTERKLTANAATLKHRHLKARSVIISVLAVLAISKSHNIVPPSDTTLNYFHLHVQHDTDYWFSNKAITLTITKRTVVTLVVTKQLLPNF